VVFGFTGGSWRFTDRYGEEWNIALVQSSEQKPDAGAPPWTKRSVVERLVFQGFSASGATDDEIAGALLRVYDQLTNRRLSRELPRPTNDPRRLLRAFDAEMRETLLQAFADDRIRIARAERAPWPFPDRPSAPPSSVAVLPVGEQPTYFVVRVVDEVGQGIDGISVVFSADGADTSMTTDPSGLARLDGVEASAASCRLGSIAAVRDKLKPRWAQPRDPDILQGDGVVVRELGEDALDPISLESETLATLVLTPYFQCHEIPGAHFEFGRSFVRSDALDLLAEIAESLTGDAGRKALIFGHTDLAGPEALNKELSERRAKALYALLTQDADALEELYSGSADGPNWQEKWDTEEIQHMLNALGATDDAGSTLVEDGVSGPSTKQAVRRFQSGNYPDCPAEQAPLDVDGVAGHKTRHELFLAYAKRISREAVDPAKITKFGDAQFMGCGEYNPMSLTVKDEESRRAVIFLYDPAAEPRNLPCKLRSLGPCNANCGPLPTEPDPNGKPPYRCKVYQEVAKKCPCQAGPDLSHDILVNVPVTLTDAQNLPHVFLLESDDGTVQITQSLATEARALGDAACALHFTSLPEIHSYRLSYTADGPQNVLFDFTPYDALPNLVLAGGVEMDTGPVAQMFASMDAPDDAFADAISPSDDDDVPTHDPPQENDS
jgi:outer membrane protein OmpA-like peptidoglycan-associated protein